MLGEFHAFGSDPVNIRCADLRLPVAAQLAVAQVISKDKDDIGFLTRCASTKLKWGHRQRRSAQPDSFKKIPSFYS
jgi:hypothetical protein